jgi:hypothetical protein
LAATSFLQTLGDLARRGGAERATQLAEKGWRRIATGASDWLAARRAVVLEPYRRTTTLKAYIVGALATLGLAIFCLAYGFYFGLMAPYLFVTFLVPIALIAILIVWALPDARAAPTYGIELLFPAVITVRLMWPDYVAIALPGLPWITLLRMFSFPLVGFFLICLSVSAPLRQELARTCRATLPLWLLLGGFLAVQLLTLGISGNKISSTQIVVLFQVNCTSMLLISALIFRETRFVERFIGYLCVIAFVLCFVGMYELRVRHVIWAGHIPSFLRIPDPSVQLMLIGGIRMWTDIYRVKATFITPLAFAEYLSLLTPFLLHFAFTQRQLWQRLAASALVFLIFYVIRLTDSHLGMVGMLVSVLLYGPFRAVINWRERPHDFFASAVVYAAPFVFCGAVGLVFASHRLHDMVFGGADHAGSADARKAQLAMALPKVWANPLGYGAGQCGLKMGFAKGDFITIDNYFIGLILDFGVLGVIFWYGMFILGIYWTVRYSLSKRYVHRPEAQWLAPLGVCLSGFLIVKWVHGQDDNHSLFFSLLGMIAALVYRLKMSDGESREVASSRPQQWAPTRV